MENFTVPTKADVSENNQALFNNLEKGLGQVPNLYAYLAKNETALGDYLTLQNRKSNLKAKEKEIVNLVVSQVNECDYCLAAHTLIGKMNGFTDDQVLEIRSGHASFDSKFNALAEFVKETTLNRGKASQNAINNLFEAGYNEAALIDIIILIGDKTVTNYLHRTTQLPIDFPLAPALQTA
ncbi:carboxymuconolactone decarboxylase family protein [Flavobacterium sp. NRK1]|uniref:carboxymuconolactone decarboxylase family protein n=1 Tax=Flavobacterium sp. NRK1 TaxID=2954929 RepID=UPI002092D580|nr:carboxymuconolactone decarboxylase family protein [Flavobacterium sp. NRK1]MCO6149155.1 carboxymuconolactone decarboxylase family protein [Flavobacterium sp. NRK1]